MVILNGEVVKMDQADGLPGKSGWVPSAGTSLRTAFGRMAASLMFLLLLGAASVPAAFAQTNNCGDGNKQGNEECDDGNAASGDGCTAVCELEAGWDCPIENAPCVPICGDEIEVGSELEPGACDQGTANGDDKPCTSDCLDALCGDGNECSDPSCTSGADGQPEECDTGASNAADAPCLADCTEATCGDGDVCSQDGCTSGPEDGVEACDDGAGNAPDSPCLTDCAKASCGDGNLCSQEGCTSGPEDSVEECDDGGSNAEDAPCLPTCTIATCGDSEVCSSPDCTSGRDGSPEVCDDGNTVRGDTCDPNCTLPACGNDEVAPGEGCDDGNTAADDGCSPDCTVEDGWECQGRDCKPKCGDGQIKGKEKCDNGASNGDDKPCTSECTNAVCGDGKECTDASCTSGAGGDPEQCDDANASDRDNCVAGCVLAACGDGKACDQEGCESGPGGKKEECDNGVANGDDRPCTSECAEAKCGDGKVCDDAGCSSGPDGGAEQCDDGSENGDNKPCLTTCSDAACGDGFTCDAEGCSSGPGGGIEECDDADADDTDRCLTGCRDAVCGDGVVWDHDGGSEDCDDADSNDNDSCPGNCKDAACGDAYVWDQDGGDEECDDGEDNDANRRCLKTCRDAVCGDGETCGAPGCTSGPGGGVEKCDDGNTNNADQCLETCLRANGAECELLEDCGSADDCLTPVCRKEPGAGSDAKGECRAAFDETLAGFDESGQWFRCDCEGIADTAICGDEEVCGSGDANGDSQVTAADAQRILRAAVGTAGTECPICACDLDRPIPAPREDTTYGCPLLPTPVGETEICGDGLVGSTEECDDGNTANGDYCDSSCKRPTRITSNDALAALRLAVGLVPRNVVGGVCMRCFNGRQDPAYGETDIDCGGRGLDESQKYSTEVFAYDAEEKTGSFIGGCPTPCNTGSLPPGTTCPTGECPDGGECVGGLCMSAAQGCKVDSDCCDDDFGCEDEGGEEEGIRCDIPDGGCASCDDRRESGSETDVDCGGQVCSPCVEEGASCLAGSDCLVKGEKRCEDVDPSKETELGCRTCDDDLQTGTETDIDCGGVCVELKKPCTGAGDGCKENTDCFVGDQSRCEKDEDGTRGCRSCSDGDQTGTETDTDCGGVCVSLDKPCREAGDGCKENTDCSVGGESRCEKDEDGVSGCRSCSDGLRTGDEPHADRGAGCPLKGGSGYACFTKDDCQAGLQCYYDRGVCDSTRNKAGKEATICSSDAGCGEGDRCVKETLGYCGDTASFSLFVGMTDEPATAVRTLEVTVVVRGIVTSSDIDACEVKLKADDRIVFDLDPGTNRKNGEFDETPVTLNVVAFDGLVLPGKATIELLSCDNLVRTGKFNAGDSVAYPSAVEAELPKGTTLIDDDIPSGRFWVTVQ